MSRSRVLILIALCAVTFASCSMFRKSKQGCPSDGRNVGAEKLLSEGKGKKKQPKFRGAQSY